MIIEVGQYKYEVEYTENPESLRQWASGKHFKWITYDTETDGLHITANKPFLAAVCAEGHVWAFPATREMFEALLVVARHAEVIYAHNTTFDMHMAANIMGSDFPLKFPRWGDTMGNCRVIFEAISSNDGGESLALKQIAKKYIAPDADKYEKSVKGWLKAKESQDRKLLIAMLREKKWSLKRFQAALDGEEDLPCEIVEIHNQWKTFYPKPTYKDVPMDIMLPYVATDVMYTDILIQKSLPVIEHKQQLDILQMEFDLIPVVYKMEREGIEVDREYLEEAGYKMDQYIQDLNTQMHELAGQEFTVGQHNVIKEIYTEKLGERPESTDKQFLSKQSRNGDELAAVITRLRRLEKWKATYIDKILENSKHDGRFYTQFNQFGAVSGRLSGDAQQFPKDAITNADGEIIYHPRRAFKGRIYYLDYSQIELRKQAHYTIPFGGDLNLCRAYMPFKCVHYQTGEMYDYTTVEGRQRWHESRDGAPKDTHWEELLKEGWSVWVIPETKEPWIPTDVHSQTTQKALDIIGDMQGHDFKWWRSIGKRFNFMRNYGGGDKKASETLEIPLEHAKAMNIGYTAAFPLVITYQKAIEQAFYKKGYVINLYGRRYYLNDSWRYYKGANYVIQGSAADMLKRKMIEIDRFITENSLKTVRMILCVHDEIQFRIDDPAEDWVVPHIKRIMEDTPEVKVPVVAEVELTETYWSEKKGVLV